MSIRKMFSASGFLIFPAVLLLLYWWRVCRSGHEIQQMIPGIITFSTLFAMFVLEQGFRYAKGVSQIRLAPRDILSTLFNVLVTGTVMRAAFVPLILFFPEILFGRSLFFGSTRELGPFWLQLLLVILLYSLLRYTVHRIQHTVPFLWELHSYHHSVTDLKASNTFVSHPIDYSLRNVLTPIILATVGFNPTAILFGAGLLGTASILSHWGAGLHAGWLNYVFMTPEVHRWHHSAIVPEGHRYAVNYGVGFVLWDLLFRTYYLPMKDGVPVQPDKLGHPGGLADEPNYFKFLFLTRYLPRWPRAARS